jgi:hypothetical protein
MGDRHVSPSRTELADLVLQILDRVYVTGRPWFEQAARARGITLEQLAAAAIAAALAERPEEERGAWDGWGPGSRRRAAGMHGRPPRS